LVGTEAGVGGREASAIVDAKVVELKGQVIEVIVVMVDLMRFYPQ